MMIRVHYNRSILTTLPLLAAFSTVAAQEGVPGSRLETGREHRAAVHAEAYASATRFLSEWRESWRQRDVDALIDLYTDDAAVRFPGRPFVRTKPPVLEELRAALADAVPIEMSYLDFDTDGGSAVVVSCYFTLRDGVETIGLATAVLHRTRRSWRIRMHVFDTPHPIGGDAEPFSC